MTANKSMTVVQFVVSAAITLIVAAIAFGEMRAKMEVNEHKLIDIEEAYEKLDKRFDKMATDLIKLETENKYQEKEIERLNQKK